MGSEPKLRVCLKKRELPLVIKRGKSHIYGFPIENSIFFGWIFHFHGWFPVPENLGESSLSKLCENGEHSTSEPRGISLYSLLSMSWFSWSWVILKGTGTFHCSLEKSLFVVGKTKSLASNDVAVCKKTELVEDSRGFAVYPLVISGNHSNGKSHMFHFQRVLPFLVGGLEHEFYFSKIYRIILPID